MAATWQCSVWSSRGYQGNDLELYDPNTHC